MDQRIFAVFLISGFELILVVHDGISTYLYFILVSSDFQCFDNIKHNTFCIDIIQKEQKRKMSRDHFWIF